jgi:hypothetical protein
MSILSSIHTPAGLRIFASRAWANDCVKRSPLLTSATTITFVLRGWRRYLVIFV